MQNSENGQVQQSPEGSSETGSEPEVSAPQTCSPCNVNTYCHHSLNLGVDIGMPPNQQGIRNAIEKVQEIEAYLMSLLEETEDDTPLETLQ